MQAQQEKDYTQKFDLSLWRKLLNYAPSYYKHLGLLAVFMAVNALVDVAFPLMTSYAIDFLITENPDAPRYFMARVVEGAAALLHCGNMTAFIAVYAFLVCVSVATIYAFLHQGSVIEVGICYEVRSLGFRKLQELPFSYYDRMPVGYLMSRMTSDIQRLAETIGWSLLDLCWGAVMLVMCSVTMLTINWRLGLAVMLVLPPLALISIWFERRILKAWRSVRKTNSLITGAINEGIMGAKTTKTLVREEMTCIPSEPCVIAAGPLCSPALFSSLCERVGAQHLSFYDAAAPIVDAETIDRSVVFSQSRYEEGMGDYLNCPMDRSEYDAFYDALVGAKRVVSKDFEETDLFNACQPVEEVARKGHDTLRFGALKPVGLTDPRSGRRPWAVVQLRPENADCTAYNLVGFQTNLTWGEQARVFRMIPGLERAEFFRYGVMHRNSFVDTPRVLDRSFAIPGTGVRLAGQITGTEGYVEAMASGLLAALNTYADLTGAPRVSLPNTTALGSLVAYATNPETDPYQPMHVNFGLVPPLEGRRMRKGERYAAYARRAKDDLAAYLQTRGDLFDAPRTGRPE